MKLISLIIPMALCPLGLTAQDSPKVRIVKSPATSAKWSLTVREAEKSSKERREEVEAAKENEVALEPEEEGREVRRTDYELTGATGRAVTQAGKRKEEIYLHRHKKNMLMMKFDEDLNRVRPYLFDQYAPPEMRFAVNYPGVDWVKPSYFKGVVELRGKKCFHFLQEANTGDKAPLNRDDELAYDPRFTDVEREAWFDAKTGLPVAFASGKTRATFRHSSPGKSPVKLPRDVMDAVLYYYGRGPRPGGEPEAEANISAGR